MGEVIATTAASTAGLSIAPMGQALALSRAESDRWCAAVERQNPAPAQRDQRQRLAIERPTYGDRRMTHT
jgi:hypothetical protein